MIAPIAPGTLLVLISTAVVSAAAFSRREIYEYCLFSTERILTWREYHRIVTAGFVHAGWTHLIFNLVSYYSFAETIEWIYGTRAMLGIYFAGIIGGNLLSLYLHRASEYRALGASGGVCGIIFASIFLLPGGGIVVFPVPLSIPSWLYAILFLVGSYIQLRKQEDNVGHDAHLGGAVIGLLTATAMFPHIVRANTPLYTAVLLLSVALFIHLFKRPLYLSVPHLFDTAAKTKHHPRYSMEHLKEANEVDAILEKISGHGMDSITEDELKVLKRHSGKLKRSKR